ncbi:Pimeloyl-ACP methyl ester carboxylesterase [Nocardiopsis flavescens]|uniref:Pimeloyl-ACP methyl ester carboxylesterase n=1 Tax=Nocardiopsis flavescens TaxID=758803 RepID=A0A1M6VT70_9ACTN|nr:alpha/beta hydrolase [Nocardiopsis flavescens]SHK84525.1 Pimeloyl-ACP methyl ester carboxylesterase [Nocardiopsis flavescens]
MDVTEEFEWRGHRIAWGRGGEGPPLVLCHGTPWSSRLWSPFADALSRDFTVYLWDMPGYGASGKDPGHPVDLGVQGEAFAALLDHWELDRPRVVAHDYGGAVSLRAALLHGADYLALCLVDVVALRPWGSPFFRLVRENASVFGRLPDAVHEGAVRAYVAGASHRGLRDADLDTLVAPWLGGEGKAAFYRQIAQADERFTEELEPELARTPFPVHIVWGTEDTWIPVDRAHRLRAAIPGSTLSLIPEAGHLIQLDAPVALADELRRWATTRPATP